MEMEDLSITGIITIFITATIVMYLGITILGATTSSLSCTAVDGYNATGTTDAEKYPAGSWSSVCQNTTTSSISAYGVLVIVLIVLAAAGILAVVRHFGQI